MARRNRKSSPPKALAELIDAVFPRKGPIEADLARFMAVWQRVVPERVLARARPVRFSAGTLTVHTATAAWANELSLLNDSLLSALRQHSAFARVRQLRFRVGPLPELPRSTRPAPSRPAPVPVSVLPEELARVLGCIGDGELRDVIAHAASISLGRERRG